MKKILSKAYSFSCSWTGTIIIVLLIIFFFAQAFVIPSGSMKNSLLIGDFLFVKKFSYGVPTPHIPWIEIPVLPDKDGDGHIIKGKDPQRGDIVVFRYPLDEKVHFVKRNFAVAGDEVIYTINSLYLRPHEGDEYIRQNFKDEDIVTLQGKLYIKEPYKNEGIGYNEEVDLLPTVLMSLAKNRFAMSPAIIPELPKLREELEFNAFYTVVKKGEFFMIGDNRNHSDDSRFWGTVPYRLIVGKPWFIYFSWDKDKVIRWERIGRFVDTVENNSKFIYKQKD